MKPVKSFHEYIADKRASAISEGIIDTVKGVLHRVKDFFIGMGSKFLNALLAQDKGELPKGVKIYPTAADIKALKDHDFHLKSAPELTVENIFTGEPECFLMESSVLDFNTLKLNEVQVKLEHPNQQVRNVGGRSLKIFIKNAIKNKNPLMIWGAPGIGKTAIVKAAQEEFGGRLIDCSLQTMRPEDFFLPGTNQTGSKEATLSIDLPKEWLPVYKEGTPNGDEIANGTDGKGGVLFLDELSRAYPEVQNVCLKLVLERRVGQYIVGSAWAIIAASNRQEDDNQSTQSFSNILGNRFVQVNYAPKFEDWRDWANKAKDKEGKFLVDPNIISFIAFNSKYFHFLDPESESPVWASPRSWTQASKSYTSAVADAEAAGDRLSDEEIEEQIAANVGNEAASQFIGFLRLARKLDLEKLKLVYSDPDKAPKPPKGNNDGYAPDETYAMLSAIAYMKRDTELTEQEIKNYIKYVNLLAQPAWAVRALDLLVGIHPELKTNKTYKEELNSFADTYDSQIGKKARR